VVCEIDAMIDGIARCAAAAAGPGSDQ